MPQAANRDSEEFIEAPRGLHNVVVAETKLSDVRGFEGFYHYRQHSAIELAEQRTFEEVWHLLTFGELPDPLQTARFADRVRGARTLPDPVLDLLGPLQAASRDGGSLATLRSALSLVGAAGGMRPCYDLDDQQRLDDAITLCALTPTILAAAHRLRHGEKPLTPRADLGHAENYLHLLTGREPTRQVSAAIEKYLICAIDHGFNASTFTARVITSTGADVAAGLVGAVGALSGPLHGGAPSRALDTLDAIGTAGNAQPWVRQRILAGDRIMGFGHPVYRVEDPRSRMLKAIAAEFGGERVELAFAVEAAVQGQLAELKPGRALHTNVEFYAGVVMEACGVPRELFTPTFCVARVVGWAANILEQAREKKIIRPAARYVGPVPVRSGRAG